MAKNDKKHAAEEQNPSAAETPDPWGQAQGEIPGELLSQFTEQDQKAGSGFPPYWTPGEEKMFVGAFVDVDTRDPEFIRYTVIAAHKVVCHRGDVDNQEEVIVQAGEPFSLSSYHTLPLDEYLGLGNVAVKCIDKQKLRNGHTLWRWKVNTTPAQMKELARIRMEKNKAALEAAKQAKLAGSNSQSAQA